MSSEGLVEYKCLNCGGALDPNEERCPYCHMYYGKGNIQHWHTAAVREEPEPEPESEPEYHHTSSGRQYLREVIYFAILLLVVSVIGSAFTNSTIQADFTSAAVASAGLLMVVLMLAAVRLIDV